MDLNCTYNMMAFTNSKAGNKYYAVANGRIPGIYTTWNECHKQTNEYSGSCHEGFPTLKESITFMSTNGVSEDEVRIFGSRGKRYVPWRNGSGTVQIRMKSLGKNTDIENNISTR